MNTVLHKYSIHLYIFLFYTANAAYAPFLSYWFAEQRLSSQQIGFLYSLGPLIGLAAQPVWALLSDRFGIGKKLLMASLVLTPLVSFGYLLAGDGFYIYVLVSVFYFFLFSAVRPNTEQLTVSHARASGQSYGSIRVLGSISFALAVTPLGIMYNRFGLNTMFVTHLITMLMAFSALLLVKTSGTDAAQNKAVFTGFQRLLSNRSFALFLLCSLLLGVGSSFYYVFFPVFLGQLGGEVAQRIGLLNTVSAISELPFLIFSAYLLKRFGYFHILALCALAAALRWFVLCLEPTFGVLLANQLLHGITFGLYTAAGVNFVYEMSPEGMKTTGQTLFAVVSGNLTTLVASNAGGWIVDHYNFVALFSFGAALSLISSFIFWCMSVMHRWQYAQVTKIGGSG